MLLTVCIIIATVVIVTVLGRYLFGCLDKLL